VRKKIFILILVFTFPFISIFCGGGGKTKPSRFDKPRWVSSTTESILIKGKLTKLTYVSNYLGGDIIPIDSERKKAIDTDLFNDEITSIPVAPKLGQIFAQTSEVEGYSFDIFVLSEEAMGIYLIRALEAGSVDEENLTHELIDIGNTSICNFSKPFFEDEGDDSSNPSMGSMTLGNSAVSENWIIKYSKDDKAYTVEGSVSGIQQNLAKENEAYLSDDESLSFIIYSGQRKTTNKDNFTFGVNCSKPLLLSGIPSAFEFANSRLFVAIKDLNKIEVYDENFSFIQDINLNDGSGDDFTPSYIKEIDDKIYVSNSEGNTLAEINPETYAVSYSDVSESISFIAAIEGEDDIYLLPLNSKKIIKFSISNKTVSDTLSLREIPRSMLQIDDEDEIKRAFLTNLGNEIDIIDITNFEIMDQNERSDEESYFTQDRFTDFGAKSDPKLLDVQTVDGLAKSERWLLTYNGVIPQTYSETGNISGKTFNDSNASFDSANIAAKDILIINPFEGDKEEIEIESVTDGNNIILKSNPTNTGVVKYHIRSDENYTVYGSLSGFQQNRLEEGVPYTTDSGSLTINVISSLNDPTTEGDFFTFLTDDGVESLTLKGKVFPIHMDNLVRESDAKSLVFVANEGSNDISIIEVDKLREWTSIR